MTAWSPWALGRAAPAVLGLGKLGPVGTERPLEGDGGTSVAGNRKE